MNVFLSEYRGFQFHKIMSLLKYANNENRKYNVETGFRIFKRVRD
jgi:hypothetical protein